MDKMTHWWCFFSSDLVIFLATLCPFCQSRSYTILPLNSYCWHHKVCLLFALAERWMGVLSKRGQTVSWPLSRRTWFVRRAVLASVKDWRTRVKTDTALTLSLPKNCYCWCHLLLRIASQKRFCEPHALILRTLLHARIYMHTVG